MKLFKTILLFLALSASAYASPVKISNINVKLTTGFCVDATTNYPSHMLVRYGMSPTSLKYSVADFVYKYSHKVEVNGLSFGTKYFYQIFVSGRHGAKANTKVLYYITERQ